MQTLNVARIPERTRAYVIGAVVVTMTLAAQFGFGAWPFVPYDMFIRAGSEFYLLQIVEVGKEGRVWSFPQNQFFAPIRGPALQQVLHSRYRRPEGGKAFCRDARRWVRERGSAPSLREVQLVKLQWLIEPLVSHEPESEVLVRCAL